MADASSRGWGPAPAPRSLMVDVRAGEANVEFPGGVHRGIADLVVALVNRIEQHTGERARPGWCWGYAPRTVRGSTTVWSNHAWGLAIDFNAPAHPLGQQGTWGAAAPDVSEIARSLGFRWGGDYAGRKDEMHFEFMGTPDDARRRIDTLEDDMTPEQQEVLEDLTDALASVNSNGWFAAESVKHLRNHPSSGGGLSEADVRRIATEVVRQIRLP